VRREETPQLAEFGFELRPQRLSHGKLGEVGERVAKEVVGGQLVFKKVARRKRKPPRANFARNEASAAKR
jgi:hypothetical protein